MADPERRGFSIRVIPSDPERMRRVCDTCIPEALSNQRRAPGMPPPFRAVFLKLHHEDSSVLQVFAQHRALTPSGTPSGAPWVCAALGALSPGDTRPLQAAKGEGV